MLNPIALHKAVLWEEAKGKLRALYMVNGQTSSEIRHHVNWLSVKDRVEEFIYNFEANSLHE